MTTLLTDKREIESISHGEFYAEVGTDGVTEMYMYGESGGMEVVPAVAIYRGEDEPASRIILGPGWRVDYVIEGGTSDTKEFQAKLDNLVVDLVKETGTTEDLAKDMKKSLSEGQDEFNERIDKLSDRGRTKLAEGTQEMNNDPTNEPVLTPGYIAGERAVRAAVEKANKDRK